MDGLRLKSILLFALCSAALLFSACTKSSPRSAEPGAAMGGQAGGGGFVKESTDRQVSDALDLALKYATNPNPNKNLIVQYWMERGKDGSIAVIRNQQRLFPNVKNNGTPISDSELSSPALERLGKNKLTRLRSGDCPLGPGEESTDAYVSSFDLNAEICFSIGKLMRLPPSDLLRHILGLVLHEATHMGGADEVEARLWQEDFEKYFGFTYGDISKGSVEIETRERIVEARESLQAAIDAASANTSDPRIYEFVGRFSEQLSKLPDLWNALALEIKLKPAHPELIDNYTNAAIALIERTHTKFETRGQVLHVNGLPVPIFLMSPKLVQNALLEMRSSLATVERNFKAFMDDSLAPFSTCILPNGNIDPKYLVQGDNHTHLFLPDRKCQVLEMKPVDIQTE